MLVFWAHLSTRTRIHLNASNNDDFGQTIHVTPYLFSIMIKDMKAEVKGTIFNILFIYLFLLIGIFLSYFF